MINELKGYSIISLLIVYCLLLIAINYLLQSFLFTNQVFYHSYAEQLSYDSMEKMLSIKDRYVWVGYAIIPLIYALKFFLVGCSLVAGAMFFDIKLKFSEAFKAALLADVVFIIPVLLKVCWFLLVQKDYSLQDLQSFYPLSTLNLFNTKELSLMWLYPLQTFNIFELLYIFSLGFWVYKFGAKTYEEGLNMVIASYVPALIIWVVLVMFVTLNLNPNA